MTNVRITIVVQNVQRSLPRWNARCQNHICVWSKVGSGYRPSIARMVFDSTYSYAVKCANERGGHAFISHPIAVCENVIIAIKHFQPHAAARCHRPHVAEFLFGIENGVAQFSVAFKDGRIVGIMLFKNIFRKAFFAAHRQDPGRLDLGYGFGSLGLAAIIAVRIAKVRGGS